jgi:DNA repair exonuclease SbcCD ATPase subunit
MIEPIMYIAIGFITAALLVIGFIPLVHARAVRLTMRRLEALTPLSMAEIQADKDQLRAEFAMSTRRLEMSVEQMKAKTTTQLAEIGKKTEAINRLKLELGEQTAALFALETKEKQQAEELATLRAELGSRLGALEESERALAGTRDELGQISANFKESSHTSDSQRVELAAMRAQTEALKGQLESAEKETKELRERIDRTSGDLNEALERKITEAETLSRQLAEERLRSEQLTARVAELDRQSTVKSTEAEVLNRRLQELTSRVDEQGRSLADRESAADRLRNEAAIAQKTEADVRAALAEAEKSHRAATEAMQVEKTQAENQLKLANEERAKLTREIAQMKREAETAWANERTENAVLRERINDVAAEVARLTAVLEGPASPINAMLAADNRPANGASPPIAPAAGTEVKGGSLADRIRALQSRAAQGARAN